MMVEVTTNIRSFTFNSDNMRSQNRSGNGVSVYGLANIKQKKNEEIINIKKI